MRTPERDSARRLHGRRATKIPVTVKMRAGWDESCINAAEVAELCERAAPARSPSTAGRARSSIPATPIGGLSREVKAPCAIPVIGNGDVRYGEDALPMLETTGCDALS